jgi:hypothetical protein
MESQAELTGVIIGKLILFLIPLVYLFVTFIESRKKQINSYRWIMGIGLFFWLIPSVLLTGYISTGLSTAGFVAFIVGLIMKFSNKKKS